MVEINQDAAMAARREAFLGAPPEAVWAVLADIEGWPAWQPGVSSVALEGDLAMGTTFRWKANGASIRSTIRELEPGRSIGWTGNSLGMQAVHRWRFEPEEGGTRVVTEESLSGWFATLLKLFDRAFLAKSLSGSLQALAREAERRTSP